jgi:hypothetical protein
MCTNFDIYDLHWEADKNYVTGRTKLYIYISIFHLSGCVTFTFVFSFYIWKKLIRKVAILSTRNGVPKFSIMLYLWFFLFFFQFFFNEIYINWNKLWWNDYLFDLTIKCALCWLCGQRQWSCYYYYVVW